MKRNNRVLHFVYFILLTFCIATVVNVFLVSVLQIHPRSGTSLVNYVQNISVVSDTVHSKRGNIYASSGEVVAQDSVTYDVICYLSESRVGINNTPAYIVDKVKTAQVLSDVTGGDYSEIYFNLTNNPKLYQTEIGVAGKNLSADQKAEIESYGLPGIDFRVSYKRTYPEGENFAPYLIGFAQSNEDGKLVGKMGLEQYLNAELSGVDGSHTYQRDKNGYVLEGMFEEETAAVNGYDVYTTIDSSIQDALQISFDELADGHGDAWASVVDVETGKILAWGQDPGFDPNKLNITNYNNLGSYLAYEPGSVFKSFIYAAAIDSGKYNGNATFDSDPFCYSSYGAEPVRTYSGNGYGCIYNANKKAWGTIPLDYGLIFSSNVATSTLLADWVGSETYLEYVKKFGFFSEVDTDGISETSGVLNYTYPVEKLSLTYGQGSSVTMLQLLQAYTAIFGNGEMLKPYYIDKIVNTDTGELVYEGKRTVVDRVISENTAHQLQDLLYRVVYDEKGTASIYKVDEVEIMAKTGTAEFVSDGSYGRDEYINSIMLAFPADKPKYMIYYAYIYPYDYGNVDNTGAIKNLIKKVALLTNVNYDSSSLISTEIKKEEMPSVLNMDYSEAYNILKEKNLNIYKIGNGTKVINQYPSKGDTVYTNDKVFILTDGGQTGCPDFTGWTRKEIISYWNLSGIGFEIEGSGVVYSQSITPGTNINANDTVSVSLKQIDSYIEIKTPAAEENDTPEEE